MKFAFDTRQKTTTQYVANVFEYIYFIVIF